MMVHRSAHALVETGGHPGVSSPLPILCFDRVAHCTWSFPTGWIGWTASPQIFLSPLSSVQLQKHTTMPSFFLWGPGFQSLVFIPKKGTIFSPSHLSSPHGSFQYFKDVDPLFLPLHCFSQNNKEKSISCERREQSSYCVTAAGTFAVVLSAVSSEHWILVSEEKARGGQGTGISSG